MSEALSHHREYLIRPYTEGDETAIIDIFERNFNKPMGKTESRLHWEWEYMDNPSKEIRIQLAESAEGEIAAQYALLPKHLRVNGDRYLCALSQDTVTDKKFRGQGLFPVMAERLYSEIERVGYLFTYGFPNQNSAPGFFGKLNWKEIGKVPVYIKPIHIKEFDYGRIHPRLAGVMSKPTSWLVNSHNRVFGGRGRWTHEILPISAISEDFDDLWRRFPRKNLIVVERDSVYLKWRFLDKPENDYEIFGLYSNVALEGYIVVCIMERYDVPTLYVVDLLVAGDEERNLLALLRHAYDLAIRSRIPMVCSLVPSCYTWAFLKDGYIPLPKRLFPKELSFGVRVHRKIQGIEDAYLLKNWFLSWSDIDVV